MLKAAAPALLAALVSAPAPAFTIQIDKDKAPIFGWSDPEITFDTNYADCLADGVSEAELNSSLDSALELWNSTPGTSLKLKRGGNVSTTSAQINSQTTGGNPLILCSATLSTVLADEQGNPAQTSTIPAVTRLLQIDSRRGVALAVLYINAEPGKAARIGNVIRSGELFKVVLAHEIGHALGLGHSSDVNALMYYDASSKSKLSLGRDDMNGITYLYPRHELLGGEGLFGCGTIRAGGGRGGDGGGPSIPSQLLAGLAGCWAFVTWQKRRVKAINAGS